jgi:hypothetical protein
VSEAYTRVDTINTDLYERFEDFVRTKDLSDSSIDLVPWEFNLIDNAFADAYRSRKFMMTQPGQLGFIPKHPKEGGIVAVLTGGHAPIILRPKYGY